MEMEQLVKASQAGDIKSFIALVQRKEETIFRIARHYTSNGYDAEDCISEAVLRAFDKVRQLRNADKFYVWFISILINICRKRYNAAARENEFIAELHQAVDQSTFESWDNALMVEEILKRLEVHEREILILRYLKDFTLEEISEILSVPKGTVKSRISRTMGRIRTKYGRVFSNEI